MKILWVSVSPIGPASRILGIPYAGSSGTWIQTIYEELRKHPGIEMAFLCSLRNVKCGDRIYGKTEEGEAYCVTLPRVSLGRKTPSVTEQTIKTIIDEIEPDVIHIWGTETCIQNVITTCSPKIPKVVFIQGLIGVHARYHHASLNRIGIKYGRNPLEWAIEKIHDYLFQKQVLFEKQELIISKNIILDNEFTAAYCKALSKDIRIFNYPQLANNVFTENQWSLFDCEKETIFTVYGAVQDKGLHQLIRALVIVKNQYPNVKLYIPGAFHTDETGMISSSKKIPAYERLIQRLIVNARLEKNIVFCGKLTPKQMAECLAKANVFVNPSAMEVHAGSLREAMTVGVPSISTYCGSVGEYLIEGKTGLLYRYEEHEVLAQKIIKLFRDEKLACEIAREGQKAMETKRKNRGNILEIYKTIAKGQ